MAIGHRHVARLRPDEPLDGWTLGVGLGVFEQMQHHAGAARRRFDRHRIDWRYREGPLAVRGPDEGFFSPGAAGDHLDTLRNHEGRIEANAEPADQRRVFVALRRLDAIEKRLGARARDRAQRFDHFFAAHADAIVLHRHPARLGVERDRDARLRVVAEQRRRRDGFVTQPLAGVGGVRDQLAQKHRFFRINRMHHQLQQLGDIGFERAAFRSGLLDYGHGGVPSANLLARKWRESPADSSPRGRRLRRVLRWDRRTCAMMPTGRPAYARVRAGCRRPTGGRVSGAGPETYRTI